MYIYIKCRNGILNPLLQTVHQVWPPLMKEQPQQASHIHEINHGLTEITKDIYVLMEIQTSQRYLFQFL